MVWIGLGVFAATASFVLYQTSPRWQRWLATLRAHRRPVPSLHVQGASPDDAKDIARNDAAVTAEGASDENVLEDTTKAVEDIGAGTAVAFQKAKLRSSRSQSETRLEKSTSEHGSPSPTPTLPSGKQGASPSSVLQNVPTQSKESALPRQKPPSTDRSMPPPPRPGSLSSSSSASFKSASSSQSLMPPPSVRSSALRPLPQANGTVRTPPSAAAALRGPSSLRSSGGSGSSSSLGVPVSTSTLPPASRPSRKVLLDPGHSPLDWARVTQHPPAPTYLRGDDVPPQLVRVTPSQVRQHHGRRGQNAWGTYQGRVYNLTPYLKFHPGGVAELMRGAGKIGEAERLFMEIHPWINWDAMLSECMIGILASEAEDEAATSKTKSAIDMESMD